jgi:ATP-dependent Lon protease
MQKVMRESVAAAAQFIKTHAKDVGLPNDWQENYDIAFLATMMGIPKEGPSAGIRARKNLSITLPMFGV